MEKIIVPKEIKLDEKFLDKTVLNINEILRKGANALDIPINYLLRDAIINLYSEEWKIIAKEYKNSIKMTFIPKSNEHIEIKVFTDGG